MESNVRAVHLPRVGDVRAARGKQERPRRDSSGKEFELEEGEERDPRPSDETSSAARGTAVSSRQEDEAGVRLDLTA